MKMVFSAILVLFISLLLISCEDGPVNPQDDHFEAEGVIIKNVNGNIIMKIHKGQFDTAYDQKFTLVPMAAPLMFSVSFLDEDGDIIADIDEDLVFNVFIENESVVIANYPAQSPWEFGLQGLQQGNTEMEIRLLHGDHPDFKTPKIAVEVQ